MSVKFLAEVSEPLEAQHSTGCRIQEDSARAPRAEGVSSAARFYTNPGGPEYANLAKRPAAGNWTPALGMLRFSGQAGLVSADRIVERLPEVRSSA